MDTLDLTAHAESTEPAIILAMSSTEAGHLLLVIKAGLESYSAGHDCWETARAAAMFLADQVVGDSAEDGSGAAAA